ncbi:ABC transporter ATP-binding protein [Streptomyces poonensis]|uniref:ABC transporter ATP-binding protein n=1 Tax=Streptomyces poonensis TaxID=68255 RepID=A0A918UEM5_9ACTN|nr:ABC transporter ATP-binding protein [Streptomyces poonensis]GGY97131.1 ABC transporter ATP-binding protein [Streptomyces poonensis]
MTQSTTPGSTGGPAAADAHTGPPMVRVENLHRSHGTGASQVRVLRGVSFDVPRGELVAVKGRSGSGKTTLLNLVGGLDTPDEGRVVVDGTDLSALDEDGLLELRRDRIGFVFQSFGLIPILTAAENVGVPLRLRRTGAREREERVALLLSLVGLGEHAAQRPGELSGGQRQRVAIARALANRPALVIADEPTGQLDAETGLAMMELLRAVVRSEGVTVLVATHDPQLLGLADRVLELSDGTVLQQDANVPAPSEGPGPGSGSGSHEAARRPLRPDRG